MSHLGVGSLLSLDLDTIVATAILTERVDSNTRESDLDVAVGGGLKRLFCHIQFSIQNQLMI